MKKFFGMLGIGLPIFGMAPSANVPFKEAFAWHMRANADQKVHTIYEAARLINDKIRMCKKSGVTLTFTDEFIPGESAVTSGIALECCNFIPYALHIPFGKWVIVKSYNYEHSRNQKLLNKILRPYDYALFCQLEFPESELFTLLYQIRRIDGIPVPLAMLKSDQLPPSLDKKRACLSKKLDVKESADHS